MQPRSDAESPTWSLTAHNKQTPRAASYCGLGKQNKNHSAEPFCPPEFGDETRPAERDRGTHGAVKRTGRPNGAKHRFLLVSPPL